MSFSWLFRCFARLSTGGCALLFAMVLTGCGKGDGPGPLVVGMELAYPPFEMRGPDNEPDGISVRMAEDLAAYLGRPLEIRDTQWDGIIPALTSGNIDLIISSLSVTPERAEVIDYSDPYVTNGLCMLVAKESDIQSVDDIQESGLKIAVKLGTTGHTYAQAHLEGVTLTVLDDAPTCAMEVAQGKADAFIYDQVSIYQLWQRFGDETRPILNPIRSESWAVGIRKGNDELREKVNAFLAEYRAQGKFEELAERYMSEQRKAFQEMGVPFIFH